MSKKLLVWATGLAVIVCLVVLMSLFASLHSSSAAANVMLSLNAGSLIGACASGEYVMVDYDGSFDATADDGDGSDWVGVVLLDGNGNAGDNDWSHAAQGTIGAAYLDTLTGILEPTARPLVVRVYDLSSVPAGDENSAAGIALTLGGTLLIERTLDFASLPGCDTLPLVEPGPEPSPEPGPPAAVPGPDLVPIPAEAVVGAFIADTPIYWAPQANAGTSTIMQAGKTVWVFGVDASGGFYKVVLSGKYFWVPVSTMGPNYDKVWQGRPLPTGVVS